MSWDSRKQKSVALSTTEAKYIAACDSCTKVVWLHKMVFGLFDQVLDSTVIYCDNQSYVKLSENPMFHDRSKHIEIDYYFLHDVLVEMASLLEKEEITPTLGGSNEMLLIYGQSFSSSKNGLGWAFTF
jgi:hypothetical protein